MSRVFSLYPDVVRFLAAMMVLLYHTNWVYRPGFLITNLGHETVVIFFALSGFVIAYVVDTRWATVCPALASRAVRRLALMRQSVLFMNFLLLSPDNPE